MAKSVLLDGDENLIHIPLYYKVKKKGNIRQYKILTEEEGKSLLAASDADVEVLNTKWKPQTWQLNTFLIKNSTSYDQVSASKEFDFQKYRENVFAHCLVEWDMVDDKGQIIPVSPKVVGQLPHTIAHALVKKYDELLAIDEEEQKKT